MTQSTSVLSMLKSLLSKRTNVGAVLAGLLATYVGTTYQTNLKFTKNLEEQRVGRYIQRMEQHHDALVAHANTYISITVHAPGDNSLVSLMRSIRGESVHLHQTARNWESLLDAPSKAAFETYLSTLAQLDTEIARTPDAGTLSPFISALAQLVEARDAVSLEIDRQFFGIGPGE